MALIVQEIRRQLCRQRGPRAQRGPDHHRDLPQGAQRGGGALRPGGHHRRPDRQGPGDQPHASKREMDMLLSTGEQISIALCAMAIEAMGYQVVSLTGWQAGVNTDSAYGNARIKRIQTERIQTELDKKKIVLVAGFQGINKYGDITTLGRGGSDTSAVALAAALHADLCQIYTDVDGVYTADPRLCQRGRGSWRRSPLTRCWSWPAWAPRCSTTARWRWPKRYNVNLEVLSSFTGNPGTKVKEVVKTMEKTHVSGVAKDKNVARLALMGLADEPGIAFKIFSLLAKKKINVDIILQSIGRDEQQGHQLHRGPRRRGGGQKHPGGEPGVHRLPVHRGEHPGGQGVHRGRRHGEQRRRGLQDV